MMANSLTSPEYIALTEMLKEEHNVMMLNPLGNDLSRCASRCCFQD